MGTTSSGNWGHKGRPGRAGGSSGKTKKLGFAPVKAKDVIRKANLTGTPSRGVFRKPVKFPLVKRIPT